MSGISYKVTIDDADMAKELEGILDAVDDLEPFDARDFARSIAGLEDN